MTTEQTSTENNFSQPSNGNVQASGELTFNDKVIQKIIGIAMEEIDGLLNVQGGFFSSVADRISNTDNVTAGIDTEVGKKQVAVDMQIICEYGRDISEIYEQIKQVITAEVKKMTRLDVIEINVNVADIQTQEEYEQSKETLEDKANEVADYTAEKSEQAAGKINEGLEKGETKNRPEVQ